MEIETKIKDTSAEVKPEPKEELITRVSQVKVEEKKEPTAPKEPEFDFKEIEALKQKDPEAGAWAERAYKSLQKGFNDKFQEIAELRKKLESQTNQKVPDTWTIERLQQEINKPDFIAAASQVISSQPKEDEFMTESEKQEKQKIANLERELNLIKQQSFSVQKRSEDEQMKSKYANYNPQALDILTSDMLAGKVQATREHLWKVMDYEDAVQRAYELGKQDRQLENKEKITSMSAEGITAQAPEGVLPKEEGESSKNWFVRNALNRLVQAKSGQLK